jgi:hypothetical protein
VKSFKKTVEEGRSKDEKEETNRERGLMGRKEKKERQLRCLADFTHMYVCIYQLCLKTKLKSLLRVE